MRQRIINFYLLVVFVESAEAVNAISNGAWTGNNTLEKLRSLKERFAQNSDV